MRPTKERKREREREEGREGGKGEKRKEGRERERKEGGEGGTEKERKAFVGIPWRASGKDSGLSLPWPWVQSLVGELRSRKPQGTAKKINELGSVRVLQ